MTPAEITLDNLTDTLKSARQIAFLLAGFSIAAIYLVVLSGGALKQELVQLEAEKQSLSQLLDRGNEALGALRDFYEGPVEADRLNFSSFVYALDVTDFELQIALSRVQWDTLPQKDRSFLEFEADLLRSNVFEVRAVVGGLVKQKQDRLPFDTLSVADIRDLDYHKGKDAWGLYDEFASLRYALQTPGSYGFQASTAGIIGLEERFKHYQKISADSRSDNTKPAKAGHTPEVDGYLDELSSAGYRSISDVRAKLAEVTRTIEQKRNQSETSLKLPFIDQPIDASTLGWVVPLTAAVGMLFCLFYINRAQELCRYAFGLDPDATRATLMYPWIFLWQPEQSRVFRTLAYGLQITIIAAPLGASSLLFWFIARSQSTLAAAFLAQSLLMIGSAAVAVSLGKFRSDLVTVFK
jgi:hypothetical protein